MTGPSAVPATTPRVWCGELELAAPALPERVVSPVTGLSYTHASILIRNTGEPMGFIDLEIEDGRLNPEIAIEAARTKLPNAFEGVGEVPGAVQPPAITVAICTRNRPDQLERCLRAALAQRYQRMELVVVDNAPSDRRTAQVVQSFSEGPANVRYVEEPLPGLSRARNRALEVAEGEILAYTDDDVCTDSRWLEGVARGFARREDVVCVTGLVASATLESAAEQYFDQRFSGWSFCKHRLWDLSSPGPPLYPYAAGIFGTGANMAFRTGALRRLGGFDTALGAGSRAAGGEDLDIFVRALRAGGALSHEPLALGWHEHRVDEAALRRQMYGYGKGLGAFITKYLISPRTGPEVVKRIGHGLLRMATLATRADAARRTSRVGRSIQAAELLGLVAGGPAYLLGRAQQDPQTLDRLAPAALSPGPTAK